MYLTFEYREVKSMTEVSFHINYSPKAWDRLGMSLIFKQKQICVHQIYSNWLNYDVTNDSYNWFNHFS